MAVAADDKINGCGGYRGGQGDTAL